MKIQPFPHRFAPALIVLLLFAGIPGVIAGVTISGSGSGGTIKVATYPAGAAVYLNDDFSGISPVEITDLSPGEYLVNISMAGYEFESYRTIINAGSVREFSVNLEPESSVPTPKPTLPGVGSIAVDSNPGGAVVKLDGKAAGSTPASGRAALILNNVPGGEHTVTVELAGYPAYSETVNVTKNHVVKVEADFATRTPTIYSVTTIATTDRREPPVPLSPLAAVAAAGIAALAVAIRRP